MKRILLVLLTIIFSITYIYSQSTHKNKADVKLASKNIIDGLKLQPEDEIILVNSKEILKLSNAIKVELRKQKVTVRQFHPSSSADSLKILSAFINAKVENRFFIFLINPTDAAFLFQYAGRPDMGLKIPDHKLFCNWLMPEEQCIRLNSIDPNENKTFRKKLRSLLNTEDSVHITTRAGTDITFTARNWVTDKGEIYCTPIENKTNGVIVVDGCAYWGPPSKPIMLKISNGRVTNIEGLSMNDAREKMIRTDLTKDTNASILCEVGIGTNKNAMWNKDIMESEQARETCHFAFGMNLNYGGTINSVNHFDLVVLQPTITINQTTVYKDGIFLR